jgi:riboflavin synthase
VFTGLVEEIGTVKGLKPQGEGYLLEVEASAVLDGMRIGDSVCVNGACQTVTSIGKNFFQVFVSKVTASVTSLGSFSAGRPVNLERAMTPSSRFGGHIVQGHVDGTAVISSIVRDSRGMDVKIEAPAEIMKYIVARGSVTVDGISLTVVSASETCFSLYLIPETMTKTVISGWKKDGLVNIEVDILAKYVEKMLKGGGAKNASDGEEGLKKALADGGFLL